MGDWVGEQVGFRVGESVVPIFVGAKEGECVTRLMEGFEVGTVDG